jgi:hypothetical protein
MTRDAAEASQSATCAPHWEWLNSAISLLEA